MADPITHILKTDSEAFQAVKAGIKKAEVRFNDRGYEVGHWLRLIELAAPEGEPCFTGDEILVRVTHVLEGYGLKPGHVCLSIERFA